MILHVDTYIGTRSSQQRGLFFKGKKNNDMSADVRGRVITSTCIEPNEVIATIPLASLYTAENIRHRPHALPEVTVEDVRNAIPDDEFKLMAPQYYMGLQMSAILNELPDISRAHDVEKLNSISEELRTGVFPWARMLDDEDFNEEFVSGMYSMALDSWQRTSFNEMTTKFHRGLSAIHSRLHPPFKVDHFRRITRLVLARAEHLPPLDYYDGSLWLRRMRRSVRRLRRQPDPSVLALVPYLDLINHSNRPNCGIQIGPSRHLNGKGAITIHALARIEPGREICRHYNFALSRPNALFRYGFLPFDLISIVEQNAVNEHLEKERHMFAPPGEAAVEAFRREEEQLENLEKLFKAQPTSKGK